MPTLLVPPGPSRMKILDILEAAVMRRVGREAAHKGGQTALHVHAPDESLGHHPFFRAIRFATGLLRLSALTTTGRRAPPQAHFELVEQVSGWEVRATGRQVALQYLLLEDLADGLYRQRFLSVAEFDQAVAAMRDDEE